MKELQTYRANKSVTNKKYFIGLSCATTSVIKDDRQKHNDYLSEYERNSIRRLPVASMK